MRQSFRTFSGALTALAISAALTGAPASAQYDRSAAPSQDGESARWQSFKDDTGNFFGGLFGGSERVTGRRSSERAEEYPVEVAQTSATDLTVRLDRIENQIRQLTGAMEQLQFRNQQLEQQLKRAQEDSEFRFQELGGRTGAARPRPSPPPAQAAPPAAPQGPPGRRSDAFDPNENPGAPGVPQTLGALPPGRPSAPVVSAQPGSLSPIAEEERPIGAPRGRQAGEPLDLSTSSDRAAGDPDDLDAPPPRVAAAPPMEPRSIPGPLPPPPPRNPNATGPQPQVALAPSATPRDEFALAQGYIQRREYALAEESLREFLKKYPGDRLVSEAHYWLGESLFQRQRYRDAAESFLTISTKHESSGKAPEALVRLGQSLAALGEREAACATLGEVNRKYPRASNSVKQGVEREQKRARC
jgi:tol-pal system protein YbgF